MGKQPCSHLDLWKPSISSRIRSKQEKQKSCHDHGAKPRNFKEGGAVFICNFRQGQRWIAGHIKQAEGLCSYHMQLPDGHIMHCHTDHIRESDQCLVNLALSILTILIDIFIDL